MNSGKKMLLKSLYALTLTVMISVTAVFAWFRLIFPADSSLGLEVISSDDISMEISVSNEEGEPGNNLRLFEMVPGDEYFISIKFVNALETSTSFSLEFVEVVAELFDFTDDYGNPVVSNLSLLNVFAISYATENVDDGLGNITRTYYSLSSLYYNTNNVVYDVNNTGLDISLLSNEVIAPLSSLIFNMTIRFMEQVYSHTNTPVAAPLNLFQERSLNIASLSIIDETV